MNQQNLIQLLKKAVCAHITLFVIRTTKLTYTQSLKLYPEQFLRVYNMLGAYGHLISSLASCISVQTPDIFSDEDLKDIMSVYDNPESCFQRIISPRNWTSKLLTSPVAMLGLSGLKIPSALILSHMLTDKHTTAVSELRRDIRNLSMRLKKEVSEMTDHGLDQVYVEYLRLQEDQLLFLSTLMGIAAHLETQTDLAMVQREIDLCDGLISSAVFDHPKRTVDLLLYTAVLRTMRDNTNHAHWANTLYSMCVTDIKRVVCEKLHLK